MNRYAGLKINTLSNLLFICSKNQWRSPTAELLFKNHLIHSARSAGTSDKARIKVNQKLIDWADVVFVMERKHKELLSQHFSTSIRDKKILVLEIDDKYQFNDPELIEILKATLTNYL
jgi:predicted protein tyrosine phosphatase